VAGIVNNNMVKKITMCSIGKYLMLTERLFKIIVDRLVFFIFTVLPSHYDPPVEYPVNIRKLRKRKFLFFFWKKQDRLKINIRKYNLC